MKNFSYSFEMIILVCITIFIIPTVSQFVDKLKIGCIIFLTKKVMGWRIAWWWYYLDSAR